MGATLRGEATIAGTDTVLVFDANAIDHIEAAADRSVFDIIDELKQAKESGRRPRLGTMATLLWGSFLHARPDMTREEAYGMVIGGNEPALMAMAKALKAALPQEGDGDGATGNPPNRRTRRAAASKRKKAASSVGC